MQRVLIRLGIDRNRLNSHLLRRLDNTARNLATVRNQYFLKHARSGQKTCPLACLKDFLAKATCTKGGD